MAQEFEDPHAARAPKFYSWPGSGHTVTRADAAGGQNQPAAFAVCAICKSRLDVHEAARGATCSREQCRLEFLKQLLKREREKAERIWQAALERGAEVAEALELDTQQASLGVVPSNARPLTELPEERRRAFEDRLRRKIDEALSLRTHRAQLAQLEPDEPSAPQLEDGPTDAIANPEILGLLATACGVCRGECCPQGRNHAFITPETILRTLDSHPESDADAIVETYLSHLGPPSYDGSCVFHGRSGCFLPRDLRSDTCNQYLCKDLYKFGRRLETSGNRRGIVVAMADEDIVRAAALDDEGARYHSREQHD